MNTHSSWADGRMEILAATELPAAQKESWWNRLWKPVTVDEGCAFWRQKDGLREQVMKRVMARLEQHVKRRAGGRLRQRLCIYQ